MGLKVKSTHAKFFRLQMSICKETQKTIVKVTSCPNNERTLQERSRLKGCNMHQPCQNETLQYHCVRLKDGLAEVCAPTEMIIGNVEGVLDLILILTVAFKNANELE